MPEWNQPPRETQQSLDDVLKQLRLKFAWLKGGSALVLVAAVVLMIAFWTAWFTVQPEETGIVQRFGRVVRTAGPGLHFKWPLAVGDGALGFWAALPEVFPGTR